MSLQSLIQQHRAALLARDQAIANQISANYQAIWLRIYGRLDQLTRQIGAAQDAGDPVKVSWLYQQNRMAALLSDVQRDISAFAGDTRSIVQTQMLHAAEAGAIDALTFLHDALSIHTTFNRLPSDAIRQAVFNMETDAHLAKLFGSFDAQAVDATKKALIAGVALGDHPRIIAKSVQQALKIPLNRAIVISRTEGVKAYRDAAISNYRANADVVQGWTWSAAIGACPICEDLDGSHHSLDEDMIAPHPQCRCSPIPDTVSYQDIIDAA